VWQQPATRAGSEILVNTATLNNQQTPQITALANGGFVVTWVDSSVGVGGATGDSSDVAVKAQVFAADGSTTGSEILVNTATALSQNVPQITALSNGGFVVTWQDSSGGVGGAAGDSSGGAVKAQVFAADGSTTGSEILVNTATANNQNTAQITALSNGGFVVTWRDNSLGVGGATGDSSGTAVKAQVFAADGSTTGSEIRVNTATASAQDFPQITALSNGGFVVTWRDNSGGVGGATGDSSSLAVKAQVFAADGSTTGGEILVNTATAGSQNAPRITALSNGGFVVTWDDASLGVGGATGDSSGTAVKAQVFAADGSTTGGEILVNTATANSQASTHITALPNGGFVVTWDDFSHGVGGATGDTSNTAVKAQVFTTVAATEQVDMAVHGAGLSVSDVDGGSGSETVTLSVGQGIITVAAGDSGVTGITGNGTGSVSFSGTIAQLNALLGGAGTGTILYNANTDTPSETATLTLHINDNGNTGGGDLSASASLTFIVVPVNDAPTDIALAGTTVDEFSAYETLVGTLSATDPDDAAGFTYTLLDDAGGRFGLCGVNFDEIEVINGLLLDFEQNATHDITVEVMDAGGQTFQKTITISIGDVNPETVTGDGTANEFHGGALGDSLGGLGGNDRLVGNGGNDTLNGGLGDDTMIGGDGDDAYYVADTGDVVTELTGEGTADWVFSSLSYTLTDEVENLTLQGAATHGTGNVLANKLFGNSAANVLDGGLGIDTMQGGAGNDTYIVDNASDVTTELAGAGTDTLLSSVSRTLGANLENLTLTGVAVIHGTGNTLNNIITGNNAANVLSGAAGADTMAGGLGNDTYYVENGGDVVTELTGEGVGDQVVSWVSYTLGANVEHLTLGGPAVINGTGNGLANFMVGNTLANAMDGGLGNDTLNGGLGNDTLTGGSGADRFTFNTALGAGNVDQIMDFVVLDDTIQLENAVFTSLIAAGTLGAGSFVTGTAALDGDDFIIYNSATGALFYDADGDGGTTQVQFAILTATPVLTSDDFFVV